MAPSSSASDTGATEPLERPSENKVLLQILQQLHSKTVYLHAHISVHFQTNALENKGYINSLEFYENYITLFFLEKTNQA
jgi:hypothetical protein